MEIDSEKLKKALIKLKILKKKQFEELKKEAERKGKLICEILVEKGIITDEYLGEIIATYCFHCLFICLREQIIKDDVLRIIPELVARTQKVICFCRDKEGLKVAMADPQNLEMIEWLKKKTGDKVIAFYATPSDIEETLIKYKKEFKEEFKDIIKKEAEKVKVFGFRPEAVPIAKIVTSLIEYAYDNRASDIHIGPREFETIIRFRIDGVLHEITSLPKDLHDLIITRVKVLSKLRTDEHFAPQDGKFRAKIAKETFDIRVSVVPVTEGENVVLRLLSQRIRKFNLETLGLLPNDLRKVKRNIKKAFGMFLITGPTGCGKTTTLYAILEKLNTPQVHISTIEDPVEYDIPGISQIQVDRVRKVTFARGLRSIVRQDPDIIMVGEIRDKETAGIAVNSAMTGHLVLSTMHAQNAATNLPRLIDMEIEPFLIASSVNVIVAQRLVRKICSHCIKKDPKALSKLKDIENIKEIKEKLSRASKKKKIILYQGAGCKYCNYTGFYGRIGIFEVLEMDESIKKLIMRKANAVEIEKQAQKNGMTTILEDGLLKALSGVTTLDEVLKVRRE